MKIEITHIIIDTANRHILDKDTNTNTVNIMCLGC